MSELVGLVVLMCVDMLFWFDGCIVIVIGGGCGIGWVIVVVFVVVGVDVVVVICMVVLGEEMVVVIW